MISLHYCICLFAKININFKIDWLNQLSLDEPDAEINYFQVILKLLYFKSNKMQKKVMKLFFLLNAQVSI